MIQIRRGAAFILENCKTTLNGLGHNLECCSSRVPGVWTSPITGQMTLLRSLLGPLKPPNLSIRPNGEFSTTSLPTPECILGRSAENSDLRWGTCSTTPRDWRG